VSAYGHSPFQNRPPRDQCEETGGGKQTKLGQIGLRKPRGNYTFGTPEKLSQGMRRAGNGKLAAKGR